MTGAEQTPAVLVARQGAVLTLTINREARLNALDWTVLEALDAALDAADGSADVRCVVLVGAGERAFCSGADLASIAALTSETAKRWIRLGHRVFNRLVLLPVPVIAAIGGYALGGGLELALACDLRVLADDARIGLPEVTHGWTAGWGGPRRLQALVGPARAREAALLGELIDASTAAAWGLAYRVVSRSQLRDDVRRVATRVAAFDAGAMRRTKAMLDLPALMIGEADIEADAEELARLAAAGALQAGNRDRRTKAIG